MHEYSIVQSLLDSCEEHAKNNDSTKVTKVVVKIGVLSGVEPNLLQTAFDTFKEKTVCENAEFIINHQKIVVHCHSCGEESTLEKHEFACPKCESTHLKVIDGEEMFLMSLEME
ncbi:hydrogenase maturation nickel metallochaperone HypA [Halarcobacter ebronensis]|uniref:Hydrogenase maturation factor HypA n=1 Tax=Halarcobacter ebronensis TaxID=1462615 RepID=A0A4Q0YCQ4_9BACT|nr:hydrogenase/urease nickel incorporation protein HypA [Halarcobacter ebronensis]QKF81652.1 hydrogenase nickel insertion protein HypA [Halarcobacter ebronensis]RXJ68190.1 hydrogenase maturation nickel metallochaperone HypA [Halarcobacter ebronensis]RXK05576.1 hydrogenase maturation nickel metallochaperone HypA [Halarcobacter ebronensis]